MELVHQRLRPELAAIDPHAAAAGRLTAVLLLLTAACSSADPAPSPPPTPSPIAIDWSALADLEPVTVDGVTMKDCEGDAPLLCFERHGRPLGSVELGLFPRDPSSDPETLEEVARDHQRTFAADRKEGCPPGYSARFDAPRRLRFAGLDGIRSGFTVRDPDGRAVERNITYFAIDGSRLITLGVEGLAAEGSCLEVLGGFDVETATQLLPLFDRIAAGTVPPNENPF